MILCYSLKTITENVFRGMNSLKRVTIKDVARSATVSPATVSRVLNGQPYIREETRQQVLQAVAELDYTPDKRAQALRKRKTGIIGIIMPDISNPFFSLLVRGVEHEAHTQGYSVLICDSENSLEGEQHALRTLFGERADGVILTSVVADNVHLESFVRKGVPLVIADRRIAGLKAPAVIVDGVQDGYRLTQYLIKLGYREIAFIQGPAEVSTAADRFAGYRQGLADQGLMSNEDYLVRGDYTFEGGCEATRNLLSRGRPQAIIASNDMMAIGALYALQERGLQVPGEIGVAGFDNIPLATWVHPRLTTVEIPAYLMGQEAMRLLASCMGGRAISSATKLLKTRLVKGQSCRSLSVDRREVPR